jgi:thiol-disulfide isomerase/thioredoxin
VVAVRSILLVFAFAAACSAEILEFTGSSCPACRHMDPIVRQLQDAGLTIRQIQVDQNPTLAAQYNVRAIPTFVLISNGKELDRIVGGASAEQLAQLYQKGNAPVIRGQNAAASTASTPLPGLDTGRMVPVHPRQETTLAAQAPAGSTPAVAASGSTAAPIAHTPTSAGTSPVAVAMAATVRLKVVDDGGHGYGTGTIIDVHEDEALVLTCGHIFRESGGKGRIFCDMYGAGAPKEIEGKLISFDQRRDVGLVSFRPGVPVAPVSIGGMGYSARKGESVFAIGCNRGDAPTVIDNRVLDVNRYNGPPNLVVGGRPIDGRSGGGLFSASGVLIGVCNAADPELDEGLYAAIDNIHAELDSAGLGFIYRRPPVSPMLLANNPAQSTASTAQTMTPPAGLTPHPAQTPGPVPASLEVPPMNTTPPNLSDMNPAAVNATAAAQENATEQEFVYIRWAQGGKDQVYMLERPSDEFLQSLSRELNRRGPHLPTESRVQHPSR